MPIQDLSFHCENRMKNSKLELIEKTDQITVVYYI